MRRNFHPGRFGFLAIALATLSMPSFTQSNVQWSGTVQCQVDDQDQNYSRHETQMWTITGAPTFEGSMPVYPATWSAAGQGALQRVQGAQITNIQWTANVAPMPASLVIFVRASDKRLIIKPWHSQERMDYAVNGMRQIVVNGAAQPTTNFTRAVWEWQFPRIESSNNTSVTGSAPSQGDSGDAELFHRPGSTPLASCQWQFTKGGVAPTDSNPAAGSGGQSSQNPQAPAAGNANDRANGQNCESPATVQQSFEAMKADVKSQYDRLIQGTSNPSEIASLTSQEQKMLASLSNQEQHDAIMASEGCLPASTGGTQYTGNPNPGSSTSAAGNPNAGGGPNVGTNPGARGIPGAGSGTGASSNPNAGGGPNGSAGATSPATTPQLLSLAPNTVSQAGTASIRLIGQGTHWQNPTTNVSFGPQVTVQSFTADPSGTSAVATVSVAPDASPGSRPVMLMSGTEMVGLQNGLTVTAAASQPGSTASGSPARTGPAIPMPNHSTISTGLLSGVSPASNNGQKTITVTLTGERTNFANGATAVNFVRASQPGSTTVSPQLQNAALAALNNTSVPPLQLGQVTVQSKTTATVPVTINPATAAGAYNVTVSTATANGTETVTLNNAFTVTTTPSLSGINLTPGSGISKKTGSTATSTAPSSANYRVTMTGLMCSRAITGGGDAIYGAAVIRQYDRRSGQSTMFTNANTWVYGDTNGMIGQRKQAGTRGPMGGIGNGNLVPDGFLIGPKDTLPPQPNLFPMALWQGTLTDGVDALVISPSLWISYGDNSMFSTWNQNEDSLTNSIYLDSHVQNQINSQTFGALFFGASQNVSNSVASSMGGDAAVAATEELIQASGLTFGIPIGVFAITGPSHDRPIGVMPANSNDLTSSTILPNATMVLTREMIEKRLGSNAWTVMSFDFRDEPAVFSSLPNTDRPGEYTMLIQIERQ